MLWKNFKKAFTLAELMVVLAIIWILSASAMSIFSWAIAQASDSNRVSDLNTMKSALENYFTENKVYPQPAKQTKENIWGYVDDDAIATCWVKTDANWEIVYDLSANACGGNIYVTEKSVNKIVCKYKYRDNSWNEQETNWDEITTSSEYISWDSAWIKVLEWVYQFDNWADVCMNYLKDNLKKCEDEDDNDDNYTCNNHNNLDALTDIYKYYQNWWEPVVSSAKMTYSTSNPKKTIIWWKWTLTEKSWVNSIHFSNEDKIKKSFYWFMEENGIDPKYKASKYEQSWFWYYPYAIFRDNVWTDNTASKAFIWWTAYQITATLEKQDKDWNYHPETLIIWNYKRPKWKKWYPRSLFWNWSDVIVNWQVEWEKAKYVKKPNWTTNRWIPYPVEEIE